MTYVQEDRPRIVASEMKKIRQENEAKRQQSRYNRLSKLKTINKKEARFVQDYERKLPIKNTSQIVSKYKVTKPSGEQVLRRVIRERQQQGGTTKTTKYYVDTPINKYVFYPSGKKSKVRKEKIQATRSKIPTNLAMGIVPKTETEKRFLQHIEQVVMRDERLKGNFQKRLESLGLKIKDSDKWYNKALKGVGTAGVGFLSGGEFIANAVDKAVIQGRALMPVIIEQARKMGFYKNIPKTNVEKDVSKYSGSVTDESKRALKETPSTVWNMYDPRKPENWGNIILTFAGTKFIKKTIAKGSKNYVPSVRNAQEMRTALTIRQKALRTAKATATEQARKGINKKANLNLIKKINKVDKSITESQKKISKIIRDRKTVKLEDMNPLIKTSELIKNIGKDKTLYHATSTKYKKLFGQKGTKIKTTKEIIEAVRKGTKEIPRKIISKNKIDKTIIKYVRKKKGIISGSKAQNTLVKEWLTRPSKDIDVLVNNPKTIAKGLVKTLKKKYKGARISITKKTRSYTVKINGKEIADFVKRPRGTKFLRIGEDRIASPEVLAKSKIRILKEARFSRMRGKASKDLKRLTGKIFSDKAFMKKFKDPKNVMTIKQRPKGMGASRIKFGEDQLFWDLEVPTGYAYNSMVKNIIPKPLIKLAKNIGFKKSFIKKLDNLKYIKANDKFTVIRMKTPINKFPKRLQQMIKKASKGQLSTKQAIKLRRNINKYINKNTNKVYVGSRTGSMTIGERELVSPVGSKLIAKKKLLGGIKRKISIDPKTDTFFDIIDVGFKKTKTKIPSLKKIIKEIKPEIIRRLRKGDLSKVRKLQRLIKKADRLTNKQKNMIRKTVKRINKRTGITNIIRNKLRKTKNRSFTRTKIKPKKTKKTLSKGIRPTRKRRPLRRLYIKPQKRRLRRPTKTTKKEQQTSKRRTTTTRNIRKTRTRTIGRTNRRPTNRQQTRRTIKRTTTRIRPKPRTKRRTKPRPKPRTIKRIYKRTIKRINKRTTPRPIPRPIPRRTTRIPRRPPIRIPKIFRTKRRTKKDIIKIKKWIKRQPVEYQPSLVAVLLGITSKKIPKKITGLEIRPIIRR